MAIQVKAKRLGIYGGVRRYPGDEFEVEKKEHVGSWMEDLSKKGRRGSTSTEEPSGSKSLDS